MEYLALHPSLLKLVLGEVILGYCCRWSAVKSIKLMYTFEFFIHTFRNCGLQSFHPLIVANYMYRFKLSLI